MAKVHLKLLNIIRSNPRHYFFLVSVCIVFLLTRILFISEIPPSLYWDEASIGYNAYSISKDLKDEWGEFLPFHFRAFGEFKLPVYVYAVAVFVKIFGLSEFSVRMPSVLFSFGAILLTYFLTLKLSRSKIAAILAAFYLTFSPWFFIFSRTGYEATAGIFFLLLGIVLFSLSLGRKYFLLLSAISYIFAIYSYNSMRIIVPIVLVFETVYLLKRKEKLWSFVIPLVIFVISLIPIIRLYLLDQGASRFFAIGEKSLVDIAKNYFSHFSQQFLLQGDKNPRSTQPGYGVIWPADLIIVVTSIYFLIRTKYLNFLAVFLLFLVSFVPASITTEAPHALRSLSATPFLAIIWATGVYFLTIKLKKYAVIVVTAVVILTFGFFENYIMIFATTYNLNNSEHWHYGYKELFTKYRGEFRKYDSVVVSDSYAQPYIFALYYLKYDPKIYLKDVKYNSIDKWGFSKVASFNNFVFKEVGSDDLQSNSLVFSDKIIEGTHEVDQIKFLNGEVAFYVYQKN